MPSEACTGEITGSRMRTWSALECRLIVRVDLTQCSRMCTLERVGQRERSLLQKQISIGHSFFHIKKFFSLNPQTNKHLALDEANAIAVPPVIQVKAEVVDQGQDGHVHGHVVVVVASSAKNGSAASVVLSNWMDNKCEKGAEEEN